jgi:hypothetical protein
VLLMAMAACATPQAAQPARFDSAPAQACVKQLQDFAEQQTGKKVLGADSAFAQSDQWVLDPAVRTDAAGRPLDGRQPMAAPQVFKLSVQDSVCRVTHQGSGTVLTLQGCACVLLSTSSK